MDITLIPFSGEDLEAHKHSVLDPVRRGSAPYTYTLATTLLRVYFKRLSFTTNNYFLFTFIPFIQKYPVIINSFACVIYLVCIITDVSSLICTRHVLFSPKDFSTSHTEQSFSARDLIEEFFGLRRGRWLSVKLLILIVPFSNHRRKRRLKILTIVFNKLFTKGGLRAYSPFTHSLENFKYKLTWHYRYAAILIWCDFWIYNTWPIYEMIIFITAILFRMHKH